MLSTVPGLDDLAGAQGHRHRDAAPADRRPRREGRQRRRRGPRQHACTWRTSSSTCPTGTIYPAQGDVDGGEGDPRRRRLGARVRRRAREGRREARVHGRHDVGQPGARVLSEQIIQQQLEKIGVKLTIKNSPDMLDTKMTGFDFETIIFAWVGCARSVQQQRDLDVVGDPRAVLEASGQGRRVRLLGSELHEGRRTRRSTSSSTRPTRSPTRTRGRSSTTRPTCSWRTNDVTVDPAVPEAHPARVPQHHLRPAGQPDRRTASPGTSRTGRTRAVAPCAGACRGPRDRSG